MTYDMRAGIILNPGCSNRCIFCGSNPKKSEIAIKKQEIGIYKDILTYRKKGYTKIEISGGDPIEYAKLPSLVRYLRKIGFNDITLATHGRQLSNRQLARELIDSGVDTFRIPIYGSNTEIHESITGVNGSFNDVIEGIKNVKELNPSSGLMIHTLILQQNKEDILNIFKLALRLKADKFCVSVLCVAAEAYYEFYVPYKDISPYVSKLADCTSDNCMGRVYFNDIPYCVFGFDNKQVVMTTPPDLVDYSQPPKGYRSETKNLPVYRIKTRLEMCRDCKVSCKCDGFYLNDIKRYGTGNLKPIR